IPVRVIDRCTRTLLLRSFFFQAEDGIRDFHVTGVQTCALPIWLDAWIYSKPHGGKQGGDVHYVSSCAAGMLTRLLVADVRGHGRSEERRVGKEWRSRRGAQPENDRAGARSTQRDARGWGRSTTG